MKENLIKVDINMDSKVFSDFSHFNAFHFHRRWTGFVLFPLLMIGLGLVNRMTGSDFLFFLFIAAAFIIPAAYLLFYRISLKKQIVRYKLETPYPVYTLGLSSEGVSMTTATEEHFFRWNQVYRVFELDEYTYIYITKARAFILPYKDIVEVSPTSLHQVFVDYLPSIRLFDKRSRKS